jgi:hypothetical protein
MKHTQFSHVQEAFGQKSIIRRSKQKLIPSGYSYSGGFQ